MARRLISRRAGTYLFTSPQRVNEDSWRADVEKMALLEEARHLEARFPQLRRERKRTHVLQWGQETENALRGRLWLMLRSIEQEQRFQHVFRYVRRLRPL